MDYVVWFEKLNKDSGSVAGGKGANLGELVRLGMPVPPGFAITTKAFDDFLEQNNLSEKIAEVIQNTNVDNTEKLVEASDKIKQMIVEAEIPQQTKSAIVEAYKNLSFTSQIVTQQALQLIAAGRDYALVAIRSSATTEDLPTASFAGQQATFLNVKGMKEYLEAVKKCWASLFEPRAIFYRNKQGFSSASISVLVQKMVNSEKSGVMFTVNPATGEENVVIEATWGLGESLVSGAVQPDTYIITKEGEIVDKKIGKKERMKLRDLATDKTVDLPVASNKVSAQVLDENELRRLTDFGLAIEVHYEKPQDIEFAIEKGRIYIVQTRAVTTQAKKGEVEAHGDELVKGLAASPGSATGTVRIVHGMSDISKVEKGDILVTTMTSPDLVPTMSRSAAIVTDEGGLTCIGGDTLLLTNRGFFKARDLYERIKEKENFSLLSYDYESGRTVWKRIVATGKRKSKGISVSVSQSGHVKDNLLEITPDHKFYTFENIELIKRKLQDILKEKEMVCIVKRIPLSPIQISNEKLAYLVGTILSDGYWKIIQCKENPRKGYVVFTQKEEERKKLFIQTVNDFFEEIFGSKMTSYEKTASSYLRGRLIEGKATDYISPRIYPAMTFEKIYQHLESWVLSLDSQSSLAFVAGLLDGDGSVSGQRLQLYNGDEKTIKALVICCLKLRILTQVTKNRNIFNVQIVDRLADIIYYSRRLSFEPKDRIIGKDLLSAKQLLGNIIEKVNWRGRTRPYVNKNLLIDKRKIEKRILPMLSDKERKSLEKIIYSDVVMQRICKMEDLGMIEVFNFEVNSENEMDKNYIVFTKRFTPVLVSNSHAAIVSREMGIPAIVGTKNATSVLKDGMRVTVDAYSGAVYSGTVEVKNQEHPESEEFSPMEKMTATSVKVNLVFADKAEKVAGRTDGVGLLRIEHMITKAGKHPAKLIREGNSEEYVKILMDGIRPIAEAFKPKPVWVRTLDARSDEFRNLEGGEDEPKEDNPMLGWHGVRRSLDEPDLLKAEFEAIKRLHEEGLDNVQVMLPFVISVDEFRKAREIADEVSLPAKLGIMIETPGAALTIEEFCKEGIAFASFGTNDLTQLVLGIDRNNARIAKLYSEFHPGVLKLLHDVIQVCNKYNVESSVCGESGSNPEMAKILVRYGIKSISCNIDAIEKIRKAVFQSEREMILEFARKAAQ